jgi:hypothetical protein
MAEDRWPCPTKNFLGPFSNECLSGDDYLGSLANHMAKGENAAVRPLPDVLATLRVRRWRLLARRPESSAAETYLC